MRVTIAGTGAMACLFGARLAPHAQVTLLGTWKAAIEAIGRDGLRMRSAGREEVFCVKSTDRTEDCAGTDLLLILVKSNRTASVLPRVCGVLQSGGLALTLQNGLGNLELLIGPFGRERAAAGVTTMGAYVEAPGVIQFGGEGVIWLERHPRITPALELFRSAGLAADITDDLTSLQWGKLVVNAGLNPLTALFRVPNGRLMENAPLRDLYLDVVRETASVAEAAGIRLPYPDAEKMALDVALRTAANHSSMLQDLSRGSETEIETITGAILKMADRCGVAAPLNRMLFRMILAASAKPGTTEKWE
jgi:2-dehydropantoate 2-reductase